MKQRARIRPGRATLLTTALILLGCDPAPDDGTHEPDVVQLTDSRVFAREDLRGVFPVGVAVNGEQVLVLDLGADSMLVLFDTAGEYLGRSGSEGEGPYEVQSPVLAWAAEDGFQFWDSDLGRLSWIPSEAPWRPDPTATVPGGSVFPSGAALGVDLVLSGSFSRKTLFSRWTPGAASLRDLGELPPMAAKYWEPLGGPWLATAALHPDGSRIALAFSYSGELVIARTSDGETLSVSRHGHWEEVTSEVETRRTSSGIAVQSSHLTSPIGYIGLCATETAIYALWLGTPMSRERSPMMGMDPREIHVYDWKGSLKVILRTDHPIFQPHVEGDKLYTVWPEPIPEVRVWDLSGVPGL